MSTHPFAHGAACICEWPDGCGGLGLVRCDGCGGDQCVCICGGEDACPGCDECSDDDEDLWGDYMRETLDGPPVDEVERSFDDGSER